MTLENIVKRNIIKILLLATFSAMVSSVSASSFYNLPTTPVRMKVERSNVNGTIYTGMKQHDPVKPGGEPIVVYYLRQKTENSNRFFYERNGVIEVPLDVYEEVLREDIDFDIFTGIKIKPKPEAIASNTTKSESRPASAAKAVNSAQNAMPVANAENTIEPNTAANSTARADYSGQKITSPEIEASKKADMSSAEDLPKIALTNPKKIAKVATAASSNTPHIQSYHNKAITGDYRTVKLPPKVPNNPPLLTAKEPNKTNEAAVKHAYSGSLANLVKHYPHAEKYVPIAERYAKKSSLDTLLVMSVMKMESNFGIHMISEYGAAGLMQLIPTTAEHLGLKVFYPADYGREQYLNDLNIATDINKSQKERLAASKRIKTKYADHLEKEFAEQGTNMKLIDERFDEEKNIEAGRRYLNELDANANPNNSRYSKTFLTLAAYLAGPKDIEKRIDEKVKRYVSSVIGFFNKHNLSVPQPSGN